MAACSVELSCCAAACAWEAVVQRPDNGAEPSTTPRRFYSWDALCGMHVRQRHLHGQKKVLGVVQFLVVET